MKGKFSKKVVKPVAVSLVLALIVTFALPWICEGQTGSSESYLSISFEGIGKGLDPKGNHFDINKIKSYEVLNRAIEIAGMKDSLNIKQLRQAIVVKPLAGENALAELTKMTTATGKTEAVVEKSINTGDFSIRVKDLGFVPNPLANKKLTNAVMKSYKEYLKEAYLVDSSFSSAYTKKDIFAFDYPEMLMVMEQEADSLVRYIDNFVENSPEFVSKETGLSFADLKAQAIAVRDKDIGSGADIVDYYVLTKDGQERIDYENIKLKRSNLSLAKAQGTENRVAFILGGYDNTSNYIVASENVANPSANQENLYYGQLMDQLVSSKNATIDASYQVRVIQRHIEKLANNREDVDKMGLLATTIKDAQKAYTRMENLREEVKVLAEENYDLNIGSKIDMTNSKYHVNGMGNLIMNFVILLILVLTVGEVHIFLKSKGNGYVTTTISTQISTRVAKWKPGER